MVTADSSRKVNFRRQISQSFSSVDLQNKMEGEIDKNVVLDYALLHISPAQNSYEALVCSKGKTEKLSTGPLDQLALHLREASSPSDNSVKLQVAESLKDSSWFTKFTLAMFLRMVNMPETMKVASGIVNEMSQLEETRRFHLALHAKGHPNHTGGGTSDCMEEVGLQQKIKVETMSSDATNARNELLHAMDSRLIALKEEVGASFNRAAGGKCSTKQISDLAEFAQHFGAVDLRDCLLKYIALIPKDQPSDLSVDHSTFCHDPRNSESKTEEIDQPIPQLDIVQPVVNGISPAIIAQAERQSSSESGESSESSDEDRPNIERSRPVRRSAALRRSASPMRGIQLGRSGSRRSSSLTIRSLNYLPSRERTSFSRDVNGTNNGDEESDQPPKKPENSVRRMSVKDAINLFESRQKDQNPEVQKRTASVEVSVNTDKSVLRRWSAGMGDSFANCSHENDSDAPSHSTSKNLPLESEEKKLTEVKAESDSLEGNLNPVESAQVCASSEMERITSPPINTPPELVTPKVEEINDRATSSAEWSRQKEAELNQMLTKMMESKPGKYRGANNSSEQRGGFYSQYKEKRDEKLRAENARIRTTKEAQFKVMQETLEQSKAQIVSKTRGVTGKQDPSNNSQRPRRNSSPPVLPKKEVPKPIGARKASPRSSPSSGTRYSSPSGPLARTTGTPPSKPSPATVASTSLAPNRRKPQPTTASPTKPSPRTERPVQQPKGKSGTRSDVKPSLKGQEEKQQKVATKTSRSTKTKSPTASGADSGVKSAKPSFYSKVTKKGSVVPLESKPFLRKGTGIGPGVGPVLAKTNVPQSNDSSENNENLIQDEETESTAVAAESATVVPAHDLVQTKGDVDSNLEVLIPLADDLNIETTEENSDQSLAVIDGGFKNSAEFPVEEIQLDEDLVISSSAWVEVEHREVSASCDNAVPTTVTSPGLSSSPRIRHSLSQMLQADNSEPDMIEWGNAENPPALIYQKDAPRGFKRLLKFARKSKGEANSTGWATPSVFSEGEDDADEHISATAASTKAARSFFSLSTFRSSKSSETKLR